MGKRRQPIDEETDGCIKRMMNQKSTIKHRDDDFDVLPRQSMINEIQFPKMTCRCCPKVLVNSMKDITEIQKNAIREIGFGHVLSLSVTEVPSKLCYWLLENFEPKSCEISLQNGRRIRIQPDDVQRVFGFPKGKRIIEKKKKNHKCELTAIWRRMFHENDGNVVLSTLSKKLLSDTEGGEWFKRHFMILLTTCLIESNSTGSISPQIMHCFEEVNQISDWDWGDFVIKCLIDHTISWKKNKNNAFVGPSLFITALYVDRVVVYNRIVPRSFLTIVNWDSSLLRQRQATEIKSGGFGGGFPDDPINMDIYMSDASVKHTLHEVVTSLKNDVASSEKQSRSFDLTKYAEKFLMLAESLAETMVELMSLIENAPTPMKDNIQYKQMIEVTRNLVGCNIMTYPSVESPSNLGPLMTQPGDKFWSIAEKMTRIMEIESAMEKRDEFLRKQDDIPSFSLGLTQEIMGGVDDVASGANKDGNHGIDSDFSKQAKENLVVEINNHEEMLDATNDTHQEDSFHARLPHQECFENERSDDMPVTIQNKQRRQLLNEIPSHPMERRDRTTLKKTRKLLSPCIVRPIDTSERLSKVDRTLCFYAIHNISDDMEHILFINEHVQLRRREILTMRRGSFVSIAVLDVWSNILNYKENLRSFESPARFFASTNPCVSVFECVTYFNHNLLLTSVL